MTASASLQRRPSRWYAEPFVWMLIGIPLLAVLMGGVMITLAVRSDDGLVVDDYYRRGLEINRTLARDRAAAGHRLGAVIDLDSVGAEVRMSLSALAEFDEPDAVTLKLFHSTRPDVDREIVLIHRGGRRYFGDFGRLPPGNWHVQIEADDWRLSGTVRSPGQKSLALKSGAD